MLIEIFSQERTFRFWSQLLGESTGGIFLLQTIPLVLIKRVIGGNCIVYNDKLISIILQHHGNIFYYVSPTYIYYFPVLLCLHFPFLYKILMTQKRNLTFFSWIMASEASNLRSSNFSNFSSHLQNHIRGTDASKLLLFGCSRIF